MLFKLVEDSSDIFFVSAFKVDRSPGGLDFIAEIQRGKIELSSKRDARVG